MEKKNESRFFFFRTFDRFSIFKIFNGTIFEWHLAIYSTYAPSQMLLGFCFVVSRVF